MEFSVWQRQIFLFYHPELPKIYLFFPSTRVFSLPYYFLRITPILVIRDNKGIKSTAIKQE